MGYVPKNDMALKAEALRHAFSKLKEEATPFNGKLKYENITNTANKTEWAKKLKDPISQETIKQSTNAEIKIIREDIIRFKRSLRAGKSLVADTIKVKIDNLEAKVDSLTIDVADLIDEKEELKDEIKSLKASYKKVKKEKNGYIQKLKDHGL